MMTLPKSLVCCQAPLTLLYFETAPLLPLLSQPIKAISLNMLLLFFFGV